MAVVFNRLKMLFHIPYFWLFIICMLLVGTSISITAPYLSIYGTTVIGMSPSAFGVFMAVSSFAGVIANTIIANYSDNGMSRKWLILAALLSSACGYTSYLIFESFIGLLLSVSFFNGLGAAAMPQMFAYADESANASKSQDKTFAKSTLRSLFSLGFLIGPLFGTLLLGAFNYQGLFLGTSFIFLILACIVFLFLPKRKASVKKSVHSKPNLFFSSEMKGMIWPFIAFTLLFAVNSVNGINTPLLIINELQGTPANVGVMVALCAGLEIPLMLTFGALSTRISNQWITLIGCAAALLYYSILALSTDTWQLIGAQIFQATFVAVVMGNGLSYFSNLLPHSAGVAATMYANASTLGRLGGNLLAGFGATLVGFRYINWFCLVVLVTSIFLLFKKDKR
nr:sugar efflux transporter [Gracilibacillus phocaeensis]